MKSKQNFTQLGFILSFLDIIDTKDITKIAFNDNATITMSVHHIA